MNETKRAFVTGASGFVGRHLLDALEGDVVAPSRAELDLLDAEAVRAAIAAAAPATVFHLAALASVGRSWDDPGTVLRENVGTTLNLLEAVRREAPRAAVVVASSGEVYGPPERLPVDESAPLRPQNPYAVSKAASDLLAGQYADAHGLHVVRLRAFNQAGPGQSDEYVSGTIARQVAEGVEAGASEVVVRTGNPDSARDFLDVRDAARAYARCGGRPGRRVQPLQRAQRERSRARRAGGAGGARAGSSRGRRGPRARPRRPRGPRLRGAALREGRMGARDPARADARRRGRRLAR